MTIKFCDACGGTMKATDPPTGVTVTGISSHDLCPGCTTKLRAILQNQEWGKPPALPAAV